MRDSESKKRDGAANRRSRSSTMAPGKHLVAIADILGFTALVRTTPASELGERVWQIVRIANKMQKNRRSTTYVNGKKVVDRVFRIEMLHFSDTLLFWSERVPQADQWAAKSCMNDFTSYIANVAFFAFLHGLPLRTGLSYGELFADRNGRGVVGQSVVDAYSTEQAQEWIGGAFHPTFPVHPYLSKAVYYPVPTKDGLPISSGRTNGSLQRWR